MIIGKSGQMVIVVLFILKAVMKLKNTRLDGPCEIQTIITLIFLKNPVWVYWYVVRGAFRRTGNL